MTEIKKMNPGIFFSIFFLILLNTSLFAQREKQEAFGSVNEAPPIRERFFFGGNLGLQFGSITDIEIAPVVGFWILPRVAVAAGPDYRFYSFYKNKTQIWGGKAYVEFTLLRNINSVIPIGANTDIIAHVEDQLLSLESSFFRDPPYTSKRFYANTILAGGGLSQQIGKRSALNILVMWALNEQANLGLYSNPEIRMSFTF
jgi:hypothetical protein